MKKELKTGDEYWSVEVRFDGETFTYNFSEKPEVKHGMDDDLIRCKNGETIKVPNAGMYSITENTV